MAQTSDALKILDKRIGEDQQLRDMIAEERLNVRVARMIYQVRKEAGLTQSELADLVGTKQQAIARLEDADYEGHSLTMLQRIAYALNRRIEISMAPNEPEAQAAG